MNGTKTAAAATNGYHHKENGLNGLTKTKINQDCENNFETVTTIAKFLLDQIYIKPKIGIICGSGLGLLADSLEEPHVIPYANIPHFPVSTVQGHSGCFVLGYLKGVAVMCMKGRFHHYEGYPLWKCSMPVRVMKMIGCTHLIVTNAAGGLNPTYKIGDIMIMKDHINFMGFAGNNPLHGINDDRLGPRFLPMNKAYDLSLRRRAQQIAADLGMADTVKEGVYTCLGGPNFETVAELKLLKMLGVDAVGMSTVHEVITARHCDMTVFAFSLITNSCITDYDSHEEANHEEVVEVGKMQETNLKRFVAEVVATIGHAP